MYLLYLRGRQLVNRHTEPELRQALKYFEQVAAAEPNFAGAHAAIARVWEVMAGAGSLVAPREAFPQVRAAAGRALAIDRRREQWIYTHKRTLTPRRHNAALATDHGWRESVAEWRPLIRNSSPQALRANISVLSPRQSIGLSR